MIRKNIIGNRHSKGNGKDEESLTANQQRHYSLRDNYFPNSFQGRFCVREYMGFSDERSCQHRQPGAELLVLSVNRLFERAIAKEGV